MLEGATRSLSILIRTSNNYTADDSFVETKLLAPHSLRLAATALLRLGLSKRQCRARNDARDLGV